MFYLYMYIYIYINNTHIYIHIDISSLFSFVLFNNSKVLLPVSEIILIGWMMSVLSAVNKCKTLYVSHNYLTVDPFSCLSFSVYLVSHLHQKASQATSNIVLQMERVLTRKFVRQSGTSWKEAKNDSKRNMLNYMKTVPKIAKEIKFQSGQKMHYKEICLIVHSSFQRRIFDFRWVVCSAIAVTYSQLLFLIHFKMNVNFLMFALNYFH